MNEISLPIEPQESQVVGKTFGIRAGAYIIDTIAYYILYLGISFTIGILLGIFYGMRGQEFPELLDNPSTRCIDFFIGLFNYVFFFAIFEWLYGASLGKLILSMRVVMEDGNPCTLGGAFIRGALRYIDGLFFAIPAYFTMKHPLFQRIGDRAAKTIVVDAGNAIIKEKYEWWWFLVAAGVYIGVNTLTVFTSVLIALPK